MQALARIRGRRRAAIDRWLESDTRRNWIRASIAGPLATLAGRHLLHVFGDSHAVVFREIARRGALPHTSLDVAIIAGATAVGLANPNSRTRALARFDRIIRTLPQRRPLLFMLGEVDCGFVIWWRAQTKRVSPATELDRSLQAYTGFLERLFRSGRRSIVIAAAPPPTILDGQEWGEVANLRREVTASLKERTALTLEYNARLREWCRDEGCSFLDYEAEVIDERTGLVAARFRNPNPLDHHLAAAPFAEVMAHHLRRAGFA